MANLPLYTKIDSPSYVSITDREQFNDVVVEDGHVLLFTEDGSTLTAKTADGSFVSVGGSGGVDTSKDTVKAEVMLDGYTAHDSNGRSITGTIKTVALTRNGNTVNVKAGYIAADDSITIESSGVDVSGVTATDEQVLEGYQFVTKDGELVEGNIPVYRSADIEPTANMVYIAQGYYEGDKEVTVGTAIAPGTISPGTADIVLSQGSFLIDKVTIKGDANLKAANIAQGVTIFGIAGTHAGGGSGGGGGGATTEYYYCASRNDATKTWQGYKYVMDEDGKYTMATTTSSLTYGGGLVPQIGGIYDAAAMLRFFAVAPTDQKCVCFCHFDEKPRVSDGGHSPFDSKDETETCVVVIANQCEIRSNYAKFGGTALYHNNYGEDYGGAGISIHGLPMMDAFTIEWWQLDDEATRGEGGFVIHQSATDDYPAADIMSVTITKDDSRFLHRVWFHRAFVREAGSTTVTEYRNGEAIGTCTFVPPLGVREIMFFAGNQEYGSNAYKYSDDFSIYNYAKYHGNFTPPETQISVVPANFWGEPPVREVKVAGAVFSPVLNRADFALVNPDATGTERVWASSDNRFFIRFDEMDYYCWILSDFPFTAWVEADDSMIGATLAVGPEGWVWDEETGEEYEGEPIGGEWRDLKGNPITVTYNEGYASPDTTITDDPYNDTYWFSYEGKMGIQTVGGHAKLTKTTRGFNGRPVFKWSNDGDSVGGYLKYGAIADHDGWVLVSPTGIPMFKSDAQTTDIVGTYDGVESYNSCTGEVEEV